MVSSGANPQVNKNKKRGAGKLPEGVKENGKLQDKKQSKR